MAKKKENEALLQVQEQKNEYQRPPRSQWFTAVLYPRENETNSHGYIIAYIERMKVLFDKYAYIEHTEDKWTEEDEKQNAEHKAGTLKKPHTHIVFHTTSPITANGVEKRFAGKANGCFKVCSDYVSAVLYLIHDTFECEMAGKHKYSPEQVKGSTELIKIFEQNANFVQKELIEIIHDNGYLYDVEKYIEKAYGGRTQLSLIHELRTSRYMQMLSGQEIQRKRCISQFDYKRMVEMYQAEAIEKFEHAHEEIIHDSN